MLCTWMFARYVYFLHCLKSFALRNYKDIGIKINKINNIATHTHKNKVHMMKWINLNSFDSFFSISVNFGIYPT